jgi:hypothetical protein
MDAIVKDEQAMLNAVDTWGELEYQVCGELVDWAWDRGPFASNEAMIKQFWNERLN